MSPDEVEAARTTYIKDTGPSESDHSGSDASETP